MGGWHGVVREHKMPAGVCKLIPRSTTGDKDSAFGFVRVFCVCGLAVGRVKIQTLHRELYLDSHYTINPDDKLGQFVKQRELKILIIQLTVNIS